MENINLKLIIDGKEAVSVLKITNEELAEIIKKQPGLASLGNAVDNISSELLKFNIVTEESVETMAQFLTTQDLTSEQIEKVISLLQQQSGTLNINSAEWAQNQKNIQILSGAYNNLVEKNLKGVNVATNQAAAGTSQMTNAIGALGWTLGDANMFMVNFRVGMMSVANNIPMVIQGFMQAKAAAEAAGTSIRTALVASLAGPGGLMLAINGIMFLLQVLPNLFDDTTKSVADQKEEIDKLKASYDKLTRAQLENELQKVKTKLNEQSYEPGFWDNIVAGMQAGLGGSAVAVDKNYINDVTKLGMQLKLIEDSLLMLGDVENTQNRININQQKYNDLNAKNYKTLVEGATSLENARKIVNKWIEDDQKQLGIYKDKNSELDKTFNKLVSETKARQQHAVNMAQIEGASNIEILAMKKQHLEEMLSLYEKYAKDTKDIKYSLTEAEREFEIAMTPTLEELGVSEPKQMVDIPDDWLDRSKQQQIEDDTLTEIKINNIDNVYDRERELLDYQLEQELIKYENYSNYEQIKTQLTEEHSKARLQIAIAEASATAGVFGDIFANLGALFGKHTFAYKMFATFKIITDTIQASMAAYASAASIPGVGFILAPVAAASAAAFGAAQLAKINATEVPAYEHGGVIVGENGMEVIAPAKDYAQGQALIALATSEAILSGLRMGYGANSSSNGNDRLLEKLDTWQKNITFKLERGDLYSSWEQEQNFRTRHSE